MLTAADAVPYLLSRGILHPRRVVSGGLTVRNLSRRHRNFEVTGGGEPGFVVKQGVGKEKGRAVAREAALYGLLADSPRAKRLRPFVPRRVAWDESRHVLVLERIGGATLREHHAARGSVSRTLAGRLGVALGVLHRSEGSWIPAHLDSLRDQPPWILSLHRPSVGIFRESSGAGLHLVRVLQQFPAFGAHFDRLREEWRAEAVIHRDLKWDNCLVHGRAPGARATRLKLVDWELAGTGRPAWDVGSVLSEFLGTWLFSIPVTGDVPADRFPERARYPLERMHPALRAFWGSYARTMELDPARAGRASVTAVRHGAARLVQTGFERMQGAPALTGPVVCALQVALNMLDRPEEAAVRLLGLPLHATAWS